MIKEAHDMPTYIYFINLWRMHKDYSSLFVCVCVCVCLSVTTPGSSYLVYTLKQGAVKLLMAFSRYVLCGFG